MYTKNHPAAKNLWRFDNAQELAAYACDDSHRIQTRFHDSHKTKSSADWDDNRGFDGALAMLRNGCPEIARKARAISSKLALPQSDLSIEPRGFYEVAGDEVDVSRFLSGEPECMVEYRQELVVARRGKVASIVYHAVASAAFDSGTLIRRAAIVCALVDALESSGVRCEVFVDWSAALERDGKPSASVVMTAKRADDALDIDTLAGLFHPATFRRLIFSVWEMEQTAQEFERDMDGVKYGRPTDLKLPEWIEAVHLGSAYWEGEDSDEAVVQKLKETAGQFVEVVEC